MTVTASSSWKKNINRFALPLFLFCTNACAAPLDTAEANSFELPELRYSLAVTKPPENHSANQTSTPDGQQHQVSPTSQNKSRISSPPPSHLKDNLLFIPVATAGAALFPTAVFISPYAYGGAMMLVAPLIGAFATDSANSGTQALIGALAVGGLIGSYGWYNIRLARQGYSKAEIYRKNLPITGAVVGLCFIEGLVSQWTGLDLTHVHFYSDGNTSMLAFNMRY